jgi:hypothetical protein
MRIGAGGEIGFYRAAFESDEFVWPLPQGLSASMRWHCFDTIVHMAAGSREPGSVALMLAKKVALYLASTLYFELLRRALSTTPTRFVTIASNAVCFPKVEADLYFRTDTRWWKRLCLRSMAWTIRTTGKCGLPCPTLSVFRHSADRQLRMRWRFRIPFSNAIARGPVSLTLEETASIASTSNKYVSAIREWMDGGGWFLGDATWSDAERFVRESLEACYEDFARYRAMFGGVRFDFASQSLSPYVPTIMATLARDAGGKTYASVHGSLDFGIQIPSLVLEFFICDVFVFPNAAEARRAEHFLSQTPAVSRPEIRVLNAPDGMNPPRYANSQEPVRSVMIVSTVYKTEGNYDQIALPAYLDFENRLCRWLVSHGVEVVYKAHPENTWRRHSELFPADVRVEYRPFEEVSETVDAHLYLSAGTSCWKQSLAGDKTVIYLRDGVHDPWSKELWMEIERRCRIVPAGYDEKNRPVFNETALLAALGLPSSVAA